MRACILTYFKFILVSPLSKNLATHFPNSPHFPKKVHTSPKCPDFSKNVYTFPKCLLNFLNLSSVKQNVGMQLKYVPTKAQVQNTNTHRLQLSLNRSGTAEKSVFGSAGWRGVWSAASKNSPLQPFACSLQQRDRGPGADRWRQTASPRPVGCASPLRALRTFPSVTSSSLWLSLLGQNELLRVPECPEHDPQGRVQRRPDCPWGLSVRTERCRAWRR